MQKTAFLLVYTKKSTMLCFQVLIICSMRVVCKLHHLLGSSFGSCSLTLASKIATSFLQSF